MLYRVHSIKYDTDGEEVDLPKELFFTTDDTSEPVDELSDLISDKTGFCHNGFDYEEIRSSFSFGQCPIELVKKACNSQCPTGYHMTIRQQKEWAAIALAVNQGIDSHLEAFTRSTFNATTGECLVHPDELHVLCRRLYDDETEGDESWSLRLDILETLGIEEI